MLRALARLVVFLLSALHWLVVTIVGAHVNVIRNFAPRAKVIKREQVKRD